MPRPPPPAEAFRITGIADLLGHFERFFGARKHAFGTGQNRHAMFLHDGAGAFLDAHRGDHFGRGADEFDARDAADFGEAGVLAEKAVAGMDGVDIGDFGGADDGGNIEVAARALGRADADGLIGETHGQAVAVGFGIDRDGRDAEILAGADDAQRDLTPVGDQDFLKRDGCQRGLLRIPPAGRSARACFR